MALPQNNDGLLGNKSILLALSSLTTGNLNSKLRKDAKPYRMEDVLPLAYSYIVPELTEEEKQAEVQKNLLGFLKTAPNAPKKILNG
mgnify:FL=1